MLKNPFLYHLFSLRVCELLGGSEKPVSATPGAPGTLHGRDRAIFAEFQMQLL